MCCRVYWTGYDSLWHCFVCGFFSFASSSQKWLSACWYWYGDVCIDAVSIVFTKHCLFWNNSKRTDGSMVNSIINLHSYWLMDFSLVDIPRTLNVCTMNADTKCHRPTMLNDDSVRIYSYAYQFIGRHAHDTLCLCEFKIHSCRLRCHALHANVQQYEWAAFIQ